MSTGGETRCGGRGLISRSTACSDRSALERRLPAWRSIALVRRRPLTAAPMAILRCWHRRPGHSCPSSYDRIEVVERKRDPCGFRARPLIPRTGERVGRWMHAGRLRSSTSNTPRDLVEGVHSVRSASIGVKRTADWQSPTLVIYLDWEEQPLFIAGDFAAQTDRTRRPARPPLPLHLLRSSIFSLTTTTTSSHHRNAGMRSP